MSQISSEVDICNLALGWLGGNRITTIDGTENSTEAILCRANYKSSRDVAMEARNWTFSLDRATLAPLSVAPAFEYSHQFLLPADCMKVRQVGAEPTLKDNLKWEKEGKYILCDSSLIYVKYTKRITDVGLFSPNFVQSVAARLAADIAIPLTDSKTLMDRMEAKYINSLDVAGGADGSQGINVAVVSNELIRVR